jgi:hypothetical protein
MTVCVRLDDLGADAWASTVGEYRRAYVRLEVRSTFRQGAFEPYTVSAPNMGGEPDAINPGLHRAQELEATGFTCFELDESGTPLE